MWYEGTVTSDGRLTLPAAVSDRLDLDPGDTVPVRFDVDGGIRILPVSSAPRDRLETARERGSSLELDAAELLDDERDEWSE